jgi:molybdopterin-binding protein
MNKIEGKISAIESDEGISLITIQALGIPISSMMVEATHTSFSLKPEDPVIVAFKETAMSIGKSISGGFSIRNCFDGEIIKIEKSKLLTKIILDFNQTSLVSVITTGSADRLQLKVGDRVTGLVKTTDIILIKTPG